MSSITRDSALDLDRVSKRPFCYETHISPGNAEAGVILQALPYRPGSSRNLYRESTSAAATPAKIAAFLDSPPQTNEVGRSAALFGGLLQVLGTAEHPDLPVRLVEIGASAGLNLLADRFVYRAADGSTWSAGDPTPVVLDPAWESRPPGILPAVRVAERLGCDLVQGYHFGRPMGADQFTLALAAEGTGARDGATPGAPATAPGAPG